MSDGHKDLDRRIAAYLRGQTSDKDARKLELEMLEDDDLFERVQTEDLLRRGLELGETKRASSSDSAGEPSPSAPLPHLAWGLAAAFGAAALLLGVYSMQLNEQIETLQSPTPGLPVITLFEQRSLLPETTTGAPLLTDHEGPAFLEIDVSAHRHDAFQLELVRATGSLIWEAQTPDERGYLTVMVPNARALQGIIVRAPGGEILKSYTLRED